MNFCELMHTVQWLLILVSAKALVAKPAMFMTAESDVTCQAKMQYRSVICRSSLKFWVVCLTEDFRIETLFATSLYSLLASFITVCLSPVVMSPRRHSSSSQSLSLWQGAAALMAPA